MSELKEFDELQDREFKNRKDRKNYISSYNEGIKRDGHKRSVRILMGFYD